MPEEERRPHRPQHEQELADASQYRRQRSASGSASGSRKPPLHRNNACLACRRKKRKCDGQHPICSPCLNSAKLYQESPHCEWGGTAKPEDHPTCQVAVKQENDQHATSPGTQPTVPTSTLTFLNPHLAAESSSSFLTYDPSHSTVASSSEHMNNDSSATTETSSTNGTSGTSKRTAGKRRNLKRDNNSVQVEALQARVAELEARLQAANFETSSQSQSGLSNGQAGSSDGTVHQAPQYRSPSQNTEAHTELQNTRSLIEVATTGSGASSIDMTGRAPNDGFALNTTHLPEATKGVSPSAMGLPTPPSSTSASIAATGGGYPPSPASNASRGSGNQDASHSASGSQHQQQPNTSYFSRSSLGQYQDPKWNMGTIPGYLNSTPPVSQPQSPFPPRNLLWSQWPADLPQIDIVKALAGTALAMISDTLFILPADAVFRSLALPPTDPRFPSIALLHALCALGATSLQLPPEAKVYWQEAPSASKYHFRQAKKHLQTFHASHILDDLRAAILLVIYSFAAEQFIDVWQLVGMSCRGLPATGLNHVQNHSALPSTRMGTTPGHFLRKPTYLPPPVDDYEVFYRSTTVWMAFASDVWMGACSGWAMAIDLQDITTLLPVWPSDTTPLDVVLNQPSLDPHSQLFFTSHLDSPMISLHLSIKAMVLLRRVVDFLQRSTAPNSVINLEAKKLVRASPAFVALTETIASFLQNLPEKARYHLQTLPSGKLDSNLLNAHIIPHTALLLLYEPFVYDGNDEGFYAGSMAAANRILSITHSVYAHSKDAISMYYTQINYSWMVCNRTLIRAMRFKEDAGDQEGAKHLRTSIEFLLARNSTLASQSPLVCSCLGMIENLVKDESPWHRQ